MEMTSANPSEKDMLTRKDLKAFERASNLIEIVAPVISMYGEFYFERNRSRGQYLGITPDYSKIKDWPVEKGRFIIELDIEHCNMVCVLGSGVRAEVFKGVHPIGKRMRIGSEEYTVVGVMSERESEAGRWMNHTVLVPLSAIEKRSLKREYLSRILVKAKTTDLVPIVKRQIKRVLDGLKLHPEMFKIEVITPPKEVQRPELDLDVDTESNLFAVREIFRNAERDKNGFVEVEGAIALVDKHPHLKKMLANGRKAFEGRIWR